MNNHLFSISKETTRTIRVNTASADFVRLDVTDLASVEAFCASTAARGRQADILVNVAGWGKIELFVKNSPDF